MHRNPAADLSGKQRRYLRGLAHHIQPLVRVGQGGIDRGVEDAVAEALHDHELVKIKVLEGSPTARREVAELVSSACGAHVVGQLGRVVILYRRHPSEPRIVLPRA